MAGLHLIPAFRTQGILQPPLPDIPEGVEDIRKTKPSEPTKQGKAHMNSHRVKQLVRFYMVLHHILCVYITAMNAVVFMGLLTVRKSGNLALVPTFRTLLVLLSCCVPTLIR